MKHYLNIFKIKVINDIIRKWGISSMFIVSRLVYMYCGTVPYILEAVPCVQLSGLNSKRCKKSAYMHKIKIKCHKTDVCCLPTWNMYYACYYISTCSYMYTLSTVFNTIFPIHIYKLCLNTAYNYLIAIYI